MALVVVGILLTAALAGGNLAIATQVTALDSDYVSNSIEAEGGYEALADELQRDVAANASLGAGGSGSGPDDAPDTGSIEALIDDRSALDGVVTPGYVESQVEPNVDRLLSYLHGDADRVNLSVDAEPIVENVGDVATRIVENATTAELLDAAGAGSFEDIPVNRSTVARLDAGPEAYVDAQTTVRERVRERILDAAVDRAFEERSTDELLALVIPDYDPRDYSAAEKERMVADREPEIRTALRTRIERERGDEVDAAVADGLAELRADATTGNVTTDRAAFGPPATDLRDATVAALTGGIDHATYQERAGAARGDLGVAVGEYAESRVREEVTATVDLNEATGIPEEDGLDGAVAAVTWLDRLAIVLPALAVGLVGLTWYLTRSIGRTAGTLGWGMVFAGVPAYLGATLASGRVPSMVSTGSEVAAFESVAVDVVQRVLGDLATQSLVVALVGVVLVGVSLALKYGLPARLRERRTV